MIVKIVKFLQKNKSILDLFFISPRFLFLSKYVELKSVYFKRKNIFLRQKNRITSPFFYNVEVIRFF